MTKKEDEIEKGYSILLERINMSQEKEEKLSGDIKGKKAALLSRMSQMTAPLISRVGISLLRRGKQDTKGEIYDPEYYQERMIVLGKTTPSSYRPDDPAKKVAEQFCVLSEKGSFYELMYSTDGFLTDSYLNPILPEDVIQIYGDEPLFMLYLAMKDYLKSHEDLITALEKVLSFILEKPEKKPGA